MQMFGGKLNYSGEEMFNDSEDEKPRCNFDDFINAMLTVFQVNWQKFFAASKKKFKINHHNKTLLLNLFIMYKDIDG